MIDVIDWRARPGGHEHHLGERVEVMGREFGYVFAIDGHRVLVRLESGKLRWVQGYSASYAPSEAQIQALCEQRQQEWTPAEHLSRWQGPPQHVPAEIQEVPDVGFTCEYLNA